MIFIFRPGQSCNQLKCLCHNETLFLLNTKYIFLLLLQSNSCSFCNLAQCKSNSALCFTLTLHCADGYHFLPRPSCPQNERCGQRLRIGWGSLTSNYKHFVDWQLVVGVEGVLVTWPKKWITPPNSMKLPPHFCPPPTNGMQPLNTLRSQSNSSSFSLLVYDDA